MRQVTKARRVITALLLCCGAGAVLYPTVVRPWFLRWGATPAEVHKSLPGDDVVPGATASATRAITIQAPPERVWPWLAQIGQGRGGFYSYTWLENLAGCQIVNAERIHPEWQGIKPGDGVRMHPRIPPAPVLVAERNRTLVLGIAEGSVDIPPLSWAFVLDPAPGNATRLLIRWRSRPSHRLSDLLLNKYLLEPVHFVMERKMMYGIRQRSERAS